MKSIFSATAALLGTMFASTLIASTSFAAPTTLTCTSTQAVDFKATMTFDAAGAIETLKVDMQGEIDDVYTPAEAADLDSLVHTPTAAEFQSYPLLQALEQVAGLTTPSASYRVLTLAGKYGATDLDTVMTRISDDLAGIVMIEASDASGTVVGRSIVVGWGGFFANCK